jgi:hypothetical protein
LTHDLEELASACFQVAQLDLHSVDLAGLTPFAVRARYDLLFAPDEETARYTLEEVQRLREIVLSAVPDRAQP